MSTAWFFVGFIICLVITFGGVLGWDYIERTNLKKKEDEAEDEIKRLTVEDIRARNANMSLDDIVRSDNQRFKPTTPPRRNGSEDK